MACAIDLHATASLQEFAMPGLRTYKTDTVLPKEVCSARKPAILAAYKNRCV